MKRLVIFCLLALIICVYYCKKNRGCDNNAEVDDTIEVSVGDDPIEVAYMSPRTPPLELSIGGGHHVSADDSQTVSVNVTPESLSDEVDEDVEEAKARAVWTAVMGDTVLSALRRAFNGTGSDEVIATVNTIIKQDMDIIGENYTLNGDVDVGFFIEYKDDNYITAVFNGFVFEGRSLVLWPIMVDIKNKRRLTLNDVVKIDDQFTKIVFKELEKIYREELNIDVNNDYPMKKLKDVLLSADVLYEGKHTPDVTSYFNANEIVIEFYVRRVYGWYSGVTLPLNKIRTMIILPNFPIDPE